MSLVNLFYQRSQESNTVHKISTAEVSDRSDNRVLFLEMTEIIELKLSSGVRRLSHVQFSAMLAVPGPVIMQSDGLPRLLVTHVFPRIN